MGKYYLTNKALLGILLDILPSYHVDEATLSKELANLGWRFAEFHNTGCRVFVRAKENKRWLAAWTGYVTDFEVREVLTTVNSDGALVAKLGEKHPRLPRLYAQLGVLAQV